MTPINAVVVCGKVSRSYQGRSGVVHALRDVDLTVSPGALTVLVGPSGSGKSTLLRVIACVDRPGSGTVMIDGRDVAAMSRRSRRWLRRQHIGFVHQNPADNLIDYLTVRQHLEFAARMRRLARPDRQIDQLLEMLGLIDRGHHKPRQLSGGQQQRVAVAFAAVGTPRLLVADEPTGHLDHRNGETVLDALSTLARTGIAVVIASHDHAVTERADAIATLTDGRNVEAIR